MANLKSYEKVIFEKLFDRGGYVLDFTDATFSEFFREHNLDIDNQKYKYNGISKMKRLRAFWELEPNEVVGGVLDGLLKYADAVEKLDNEDKSKAIDIINKLLGKEKVFEPNANEFLNEDFSNLDLSLLNIDSQFERVIKQRIEEIEKSLNCGASLSVIFLCGSTLEGLLLDLAIKNVKDFNTSKSAPKNKDLKVRQLHEWTLDNLINVAYETGFIELDIKKYGHDLKDFRNYIHPRQQAVQNFNPDKHTAEISWKVLQATIASLSGLRK